MQSIIDQMPQWDGKTIWIYCGAVIAAYIFAKLYNRFKFTKGSSKYLFIILSFLSLWCVIAFSTCGADYSAYEGIYNRSTTADYWQVTRVEKGYILFNAIFKFMGFNFKAFHMIWAFLMLFLVYKAILGYQDRMDIGLAVLAFGAIYCFQSMNLMRIYMAMAITIIGHKHYMSGKRYRYLAALILSFVIHRSSICLIIPFAFSIIFPSKKGVWIKVLASALTIGAFYAFRGFIFSTMSLFDNAYALTETTSFGIMNVVYHVPLAVLLYYSYKKEKYDKDAFQKYLIMFLGSFIIGTISYFVSMLGRMFVFFAPIYIMLPAYVLNRDTTDNSVRRAFVIKLDSLFILRIMYFLFILFRAFMLTEFFYPDQIMPYTSIFS